jgi:hypothetical protein
MHVTREGPGSSIADAVDPDPSLVIDIIDRSVSKTVGHRYFHHPDHCDVWPLRVGAPCYAIPAGHPDYVAVSLVGD